MKKLFAICVMLISVFTANAQVKGYEKSVEIFGGPGFNSSSKYQLGISMINGYRVNNCLYLGAGAGFRLQEALYYSSYTLNKSGYHSRTQRYIIPLYAWVKANLTKTTVSPFLCADFGSNIDVGQVDVKNVEGFFFEPQFGVDIDLDEQMTLNLAIGINVANTHYKVFREYDYYMNKTKASTLTFHLGFNF